MTYEFRAQYLRARVAQAELMVDEILELADDASNDYLFDPDTGLPVKASNVRIQRHTKVVRSRSRWRSKRQISESWPVRPRSSSIAQIRSELQINNASPINGRSEKHSVADLVLVGRPHRARRHAKGRGRGQKPYRMAGRVSQGSWLRWPGDR